MSNETQSGDKKYQFYVIKQTNEYIDGYKPIKSMEDIKSPTECFDKETLAKGEIEVYITTNTLENGVFVSPSSFVAADYSSYNIFGDGELKPYTVNISDVAWKNGEEGVFVKKEVKDTHWGEGFKTDDYKKNKEIYDAYMY